MRLSLVGLLFCVSLPGQQVHMAAGAAGFTDAAGTAWTPNTCTGTAPYANPGNYPNPIYNATASGNPITCSFAAAPGTYSILIHLIESVRSFNAPQKRVFSITANGNSILTGIDVFQRAGGVEIPYDVAGTVYSTGTIKIAFAATKSTAIFAGIELFPFAAWPPLPAPNNLGVVNYLQTDGSNITWAPIVTGRSSALDAVDGPLDIVPSVVPLLAGVNPYTGANDFSGAAWMKLKVITGVPVTGVNGPPCAAITDVPSVVVRNDAQVPNSSVYVCTQLGVGQFGWELIP